jgi:hypothetical protein
MPAPSMTAGGVPSSAPNRREQALVGQQGAVAVTRKTVTSLPASATPRQWTNTAPSSPASARTAIRGGTEARAQRRGYRRRRRAPAAARPGRAGRPGSPRSAPTPRPCRPARVETRSKRPALGGQAAGSARPKRWRPAPGRGGACLQNRAKEPSRSWRKSQYGLSASRTVMRCNTALPPERLSRRAALSAKALLSGGVQASGGSPAPDLIPIRMRPSQPGPKDERPAFPLVRGDARTRVGGLETPPSSPYPSDRGTLCLGVVFARHVTISAEAISSIGVQLCVLIVRCDGR